MMHRYLKLFSQCVVLYINSTLWSAFSKTVNTTGEYLRQFKTSLKIHALIRFDLMHF
ncbi:hypothetical protein METHB2_780004 [Candidatus Methylobacter favarea]|uniref:Uncharacterized protein n=1 Tax=Candidatus Methylobacter favarea TaxID=2707345 RepID=A0A8S0X9T5_9GAMM|nr:hypothetical protein METHB2_780004 [Candidatus Methylobacter favarea]